MAVPAIHGEFQASVNYRVRPPLNKERKCVSRLLELKLLTILRGRYLLRVYKILMGGIIRRMAFIKESL